MNTLKRLPFTLVFLAIMTFANWLAGTLNGALPPEALIEWGISHLTVIEGDVARLVTGTFLSHDLGMFLRQFVFAASVIGYFEWYHSTLRAVLTFFFVDILGTLIVLFGMVPLVTSIAEMGHPMAQQTLDVGMSAGGFGLIGAILAGWPRRGLLVCAVMVAIAVKVRMNFEVIADSAHAICLLLGFAIERFFSSRRRSTLS